MHTLTWFLCGQIAERNLHTELQRQEDERQRQVGLESFRFGDLI